MLPRIEQFPNIFTSMLKRHSLVMYIWLKKLKY